MTERTHDPRDPSQLRDEAVRVYDQLSEGGLAIVPLSVAYAIVGCTEAGIRRIFAAKQRSYGKPSGLFGSPAWSEALHVLPAERRAAIRILVEAGLPFSVVAPFDRSHALLSTVDPFVLEHSSKSGTLDILINAGPFHDALAVVAMERGRPVFGSSANVSLTGSRYRVADIDPAVRGACVLEIDHGESQYANALGRSSTILDFRNFAVIRYGVCFDDLAAVLRDRCGVTLAPDPTVPTSVGQA